MIDNNYLIIAGIKKKIGEVFQFLMINDYYDEEQDEYILAIDDDKTYFSDDYLSLIMNITTNDLWKNGIYNYSFICEERKQCSVPQLVSLLDTKTISYLTWENLLPNNSYIGMTAIPISHSLREAA